MSELGSAAPPPAGSNAAALNSVEPASSTSSQRDQQRPSPEHTSAGREAARDPPPPTPAVTLAASLAHVVEGSRLSGIVIETEASGRVLLRTESGTFIVDGLPPNPSGTRLTLTVLSTGAQISAALIERDGQPLHPRLEVTMILTGIKGQPVQSAVAAVSKPSSETAQASPLLRGARVSGLVLSEASAVPPSSTGKPAAAPTAALAPGTKLSLRVLGTILPAVVAGTEPGAGETSATRARTPVSPGGAVPRPTPATSGTATAGGSATTTIASATGPTTPRAAAASAPGSMPAGTAANALRSKPSGTTANAPGSIPTGTAVNAPGSMPTSGAANPPGSIPAGATARVPGSTVPAPASVSAEKVAGKGARGTDTAPATRQPPASGAKTSGAKTENQPRSGGYKAQNAGAGAGTAASRGGGAVPGPRSTAPGAGGAAPGAGGRASSGGVTAERIAGKVPAPAVQAPSNRDAADSGAANRAPAGPTTPAAHGPETSPPAAPAGTPIIAVAIGQGADGVTLLRTPLGLVGLRTEVPLATGTKLELEVLHIKPPDAAPPAAAGAPERGTVLALAQEWPTLEKVIEMVANADPAAGRRLVNNVIPAPNAQLPASALFFLAALRFGDVSGWLGRETTRVLERSGRGALLNRLGDEFVQLRQLAEEPRARDWRTVVLPLFDGHDLHQVRMLVRHHQDEDDEEEGARHVGTRFLVDLHLSQFGPFQLDGLVRQEHLDLIVRSAKPLNETIVSDISGIFFDSVGASGLTGGIVFRTESEFPLSALEELAQSDSGAGDLVV